MRGRSNLLRTLAACFSAMAMLATAAGAADDPAAAAKVAAQAQIVKLSDKDPLGRMKAARSLGEMGAAGAAALSALDQLQKDPDEDVRSVAARAAKRIRQAMGPGLAELTDYLSDDDELVVLKAVKALGELRGDAEPALPLLKKRLQDPDGDVRLAAADAIEKISQAIVPEATRLLLAELKSPDKETRKAAIEALVGLGHKAKAALADLRDASKDGDPSVRIAAIKAVAIIEKAVQESKEKEAPDMKTLAGVHVGGTLSDVDIWKATWSKRSAKEFAGYEEQPAEATRTKVRDMFQYTRWTLTATGDVTVTFSLPAGWEKDFHARKDLTLSAPARAADGARKFSMSDRGNRAGASIWIDGALFRDEEDKLALQAKITIFGTNVLDATFEQKLVPIAEWVPPPK